MDGTGALESRLDKIDIVANKINIVGEATYDVVLNSQQDSFDIDGIATDGAILSVFVTYPGGCADHDFVLIGSNELAESYPPKMYTTLTHNANEDACEDIIQDTLTFDLSPIAEIIGEEFDTVIIHVNKAPQTAVYDGSEVTTTP